MVLFMRKNVFQILEKAMLKLSGEDLSDSYSHLTFIIENDNCHREG